MKMASPGVLTQHLTPYSEKTRNFIKELIRESGVNQQYQRNVERSLHMGTPIQVAETKSFKHDFMPRDGEGTSPNEAYSRRAKWKSKRSKDAITKLQETASENVFVPKPPKYNEESKERCQTLMANEGCLPREVQRRAKHKTSPSGTITRQKQIKDLVNEIEERVEWLSAMEKLNADQEHRDLINSQIALKIRDLEYLDEVRAKTITHKHKESENRKSVMKNQI